MAWHGSCRPTQLDVRGLSPPRVQGVLVASSGRRLLPLLQTTQHLACSTQPFHNRSSSSPAHLVSPPTCLASDLWTLTSISPRLAKTHPLQPHLQKPQQTKTAGSRGEEAMSSSQNPFSHARNTAARGPSSSPRRGPFHGRGPWGGSPADMMDQPFTDEMRDLQARGKDPYAGDASDGSDLSPERLPGGGRMAPHHHHHSQHHQLHHHSHHHHHHHRAASSR